MTTAFARQLQQIAVKSTNELDLRARRDAHAESLIFERGIAVKQDWETLYEICHEGFRELCLLDARFKEFERNLFSYHSKDQDREQLNKSQNENLDNVIEQCLEVLCSRLALRPGIKALEWLVRRFRIHVHNTGALLLTALPYHEAQLFQNVLSIVPITNLVDEWKFLRPYHQNPSPVPRHTIVYACTTSDGFFASLNQQALSSSYDDDSNPVFMRFWSSVVVEAVTARLKQAQSGRREIQRQRSEDVFLKVLPLINDGLAEESSLDMIATCFTLSLILVSTGLLAEPAVDSLMLAIVSTTSYPSVDINQALLCLAIIVAQREAVTIPSPIIDLIAKLENPTANLEVVKRQFSIFKLLQDLIRGTLDSTKTSNVVSRTVFLEKLLNAAEVLCDDTEALQIILVLGSHSQATRQSPPSSHQMSNKIKLILQAWHDGDKFAPAFSQLAESSQETGFDLEGLIEATVPAIESVVQPIDDMEEATPPDLTTELNFEVKTYISLPPMEGTFLMAHDSLHHERLVKIFTLCVQLDDGSLKFCGLAVWENSPEKQSQLLSFLLRVACGCYPPRFRITAVANVTYLVNSHPSADHQQLLPYASILLADSNLAVRKQVGNLLLAMQPAGISDNTGENESWTPLLYGNAKGLDEPLLSRKAFAKVLEQVYLPYIEECVSDCDHIGLVLREALGNSSGRGEIHAKSPSIDIKKSLRASLFDSLVVAATSTSLLRVKAGIIRLLDGVTKVGSTTKNRALHDILLGWLGTSADDASQQAQAEELQLAALDQTFAQLVSAHERELLMETFEYIREQTNGSRPGVLTSLSNRVLTTWTGQKSHGEQSLATDLFNLAFSQPDHFAREVRSTLNRLPLTTGALQAILQHCVANIDLEAGTPSSRKKRKINHENSSSTEVQGESTSSVQGISQIALALELVDGSTSESRPELVPVLFEVLVLLRRARTIWQSESPYALGLCLTNLLAIINRAKTSRKYQLDTSSIRAEIVIECVRNAESPQVQSDALLLTASLAELAPERVVHHVMPVFTFMGKSMLSLNDGHSVNVVNQAIDQIIPPLVGALKQQDQSSLIRSTAGLISTFVTAYDHVPQHRRLSLFQRLLQRLGSEDFGFALASMLCTSRDADPSRHRFIVDVMSVFSPVEQLVTYSKVIGLVSDIYSDKPHDADSLLHIDSSSSPSDRMNVSLLLFALSANMLKSKSLRLQLTKKVEQGAAETVQIKEDLGKCLQQLLEIMRTHQAYGADMTNAIRQCLTAFLELLPLSQLITMLPSLLQRMEQNDAALKPRALYVLASQLHGKVPSNSSTAATALAYLVDLEDILKTSDDVALKEAALMCVDRVVEKYGRKDLDSVLRVSIVLAGDAGLASDRTSIRLRSALALSSMLGMLGNAAVPTVLEVLENVFALVEDSFEDGHEDPQLHDAGFTLISSAISNIPFMVSDDNIDRTLTLAAEASFSDLPPSCASTRHDTFSYLARKIQLSALTASLIRTWSHVVEFDVDAVLPTLELAITAIDHHSKPLVVKHADGVSSFILQALDLRRIQFIARTEESFSDKEVAQVESQVHSLALKFIYKLNDNAFRPLFESWSDWATQCHDIDEPSSKSTLEQAMIFRQTALFTLLTIFFDNLKSIVTNYAGFIIEPAINILQKFASLDAPSSSSPAVPSLADPSTLLLYTTTLTMLRTVLTHDSTSFFTTPSNFQPLATLLLSQLRLASHKPFRPLIDSHIIPTIVALATAVQDAPAHHMSINHVLATLRHHASAKVRLSSILTHIAITSSADVGDEWVNNVVTGTGTTLIDDPTAAPGGNVGKTMDMDTDDRPLVASKSRATATVGGSGETMIYVNEMLEDDDDEVEREVWRWVGLVRVLVGEDVFAF